MTEFNCQISSRIPNADHNDFLPPKFLWTLVLPAVNILTFESLDSCGQQSIAQAVVVISYYFLKPIIELQVHPIYLNFSFAVPQMLGCELCLPIIRQKKSSYSFVLDPKFHAYIQTSNFCLLFTDL